MYPSFDPGFSTPEMTRILSPASTVAAMCDVEASLALALVDVGLVPEGEGGEIAAACQEPVEDPEAIISSTWDSGTPVIALVDSIGARLELPARQWLHFGATSQDVVDTARMLQSREALDLLEDALLDVARALRDLTRRHGDTPQMGRTFLQESRPTTFGARTAGWLVPVLDAIEALRDCRDGLKVQLGGPSGVLVDYGPRASDVVAAVARRLSLQPAAVSWHSDRSPIHRIARSTEAAALAMGKISTDIALLAQSGIEELRVRPGGSSSMPHKRNPIDAVRAVASASACSGFASALTGAPFHELDRGVGGWHLEWLLLPLVFHTAAASVESTGKSLESLEVDADRMLSRVEEPVSIDTRMLDAVLERCQDVIG